MIDWLLRKLAVKYWRSRIRVTSDGSAELVREFEAINPGKCMYCRCTRWANEERGQHLKLEPHRCVEGNSPLPVAKVVVR